MKRFTFSLLLMALVSTTAWAGVRLALDSGAVTGVSESVTAIEASAVEGETGDDLPLAVLGGGGELDETSSLIVVLTLSQDTVETSELVTLDASRSLPGAGAITLYEWDLNGDGVFDESSTEGSLAHAYTENGAVAIQVRITNDLGESAVSAPQQLDVVNRQPLARFAVALGDSAEGSLVGFVDSSHDPDGIIKAWAWDFGDGATSSQPSPSHIYNIAGVFTAMLTVADNDGIWSEAYMFEVKVLNLIPYAEFAIEQFSLSAGSSLILIDQSFDPSSDGEIVHVAWDFGDGVYQAGGPSLNNTYLHTFMVPGTYVVTLYVIDDDGAMGRSQSRVEIQ